MTTRDKPTTSSADCSSAKYKVTREIYGRRNKGEKLKTLYLSCDLYAQFCKELESMRTVTEHPDNPYPLYRLEFMGVEIREADL